MRYIEKQVILQSLDHLWREHLVTLDHLRQVIGWRGMAQRDPLNEYKSEAFELFRDLITQWHEAVIAQISRVEVRFQQPEAPRLHAIPTPRPRDRRERICVRLLSPRRRRRALGGDVRSWRWPIATRTIPRPGAGLAAMKPARVDQARSSNTATVRLLDGRRHCLRLLRPAPTRWPVLPRRFSAAESTTRGERRGSPLRGARSFANCAGCRSRGAAWISRLRRFETSPSDERPASHYRGSSANANSGDCPLRFRRRCWIHGLKPKQSWMPRAGFSLIDVTRRCASSTLAQAPEHCCAPCSRNLQCAWRRCRYFN